MSFDKDQFGVKHLPDNKCENVKKGGSDHFW